MCLYCLNFTEERRNIFPHSSLRGMICKSLHGSSRKNSITFRKRTIQLSNKILIANISIVILLILSKLVDGNTTPVPTFAPAETDAHTSTRMWLPLLSLPKTSSFPMRGAQAEKLPTFKIELRELTKDST